METKFPSNSENKPGTPDPTSGTLRVVAIEDLTMTEWTIKNLTDFHVTFGSVFPTSC